MKTENGNKQNRRPLYCKNGTNGKISKYTNKNNGVRKSISELVRTIISEDK